MSRDHAGRLTALVEHAERDLSSVAAHRREGDTLALELGGDRALRWRLCVLRSVIASPPDGDAVRELYGELVDRYRDDASALAQLKALGEEIRRLEAEGALASALVARSDRRSRR